MDPLIEYPPANLKRLIGVTRVQRKHHVERFVRGNRTYHGTGAWMNLLKRLEQQLRVPLADICPAVPSNGYDYPVFHRSPIDASVRIRTAEAAPRRS